MNIHRRKWKSGLTPVALFWYRGNLYVMYAKQQNGHRYSDAQWHHHPIKHGSVGDRDEYFVLTRELKSLSKDGKGYHHVCGIREYFRMEGRPDFLADEVELGNRTYIDLLGRPLMPQRLSKARAVKLHQELRDSLSAKRKLNKERRLRHSH